MSCGPPKYIIIMIIQHNQHTQTKSFQIKELRPDVTHNKSKMEWLFGSSAPADAATLDAKLSASTAQGRSAPAQEDDSTFKARGNAHFKRREFADAEREYSLGIDAEPTATLFSNRSVRRDTSLSALCV